MFKINTGVAGNQIHSCLVLEHFETVAANFLPQPYWQRDQNTSPAHPEQSVACTEQAVFCACLGLGFGERALWLRPSGDPPFA